MTIPLSLYGHEVETVFDLLGSKEDDMTYGYGWCMSQSPTFAAALLEAAGITEPTESLSIQLQSFDKAAGRTDIELHDPKQSHVIVEAKRGFTRPSLEQLGKYVGRFDKDAAEHALIVLAASDRNDEWLQRGLPGQIGGVRIIALSWRQVAVMAERCRSEVSHAEKRLLADFARYLRKVGSLQNQTSNWTYVVSLSRDTFGGPTDFVDVVETYGRYFHPVGGQGNGSWLSEPPNYIAFRYDGHLQSIHHVDGYEVIETFHGHFPDQPDKPEVPHFLYHLGPPIRPPKPTRTGAQWRSNRVWCFLDLLLTCDTIYDARDRSAERAREHGL